MLFVDLTIYWYYFYTYCCCFIIDLLLHESVCLVHDSYSFHTYNELASFCMCIWWFSFFWKKNFVSLIGPFVWSSVALIEQAFNPKLLKMLKCRFMEENGHASSNTRASHNIGRLGTLVRVTCYFYQSSLSLFGDVFFFLSFMNFVVFLPCAVCVLNCLYFFFFPFFRRMMIFLIWFLQRIYQKQDIRYLSRQQLLYFFLAVQ